MFCQVDSLEKELLKLSRPQHKDVTEVLKRFHEEVRQAFVVFISWCVQSSVECALVMECAMW